MSYFDEKNAERVLLFLLHGQAHATDPGALRLGGTQTLLVRIPFGNISPERSGHSIALNIWHRKACSVCRSAGTR